MTRPTLCPVAALRLAFALLWLSDRRRVRAALVAVPVRRRRDQRRGR